MSCCILSCLLCLWLSEWALLKSCFTNFTIKHLTQPECWRTTCCRGPWTQHNDHTSTEHSLISAHTHCKNLLLCEGFSLCQHQSHISEFLLISFLSLSLSRRSSWRTYRVALSMLMMEASSFRGEFTHKHTRNKQHRNRLSRVLLCR